MRKFSSILSILILTLLVGACTGPKEVDGFDDKTKKKRYFLKSKYERILLSDDIAYKHEKAKEYYNKGEYTKALPILDQLLTLVRGTKTEEEIRYYIAYSHYGLREMTLAAYLFKRIYTDYAAGEYAPDAMYMAAECLYFSSPKYYLDQSSSEQAIDAFRIFINTHPTSDKQDQAKERISELKKRLEDKTYHSAELYYNLSKYKAAALTYGNLLSEFPNSTRAEEVSFKIFTSLFKYASASVTSQKVKRFEEAVAAYYDFASRYPESKLKAKADEMHAECNEFLSTNLKN